METGNGEIIYSEILRQTDKAVQYRIDKMKVWIPISQIRNEDLVKQTVTLPMWLIEADGLEDYIMD
jgi:DNA-directed RNA polymerase subunit E'/Rpb7